MTLLVISPDYASHLYPLATLATAWRDAGERVVVATGPATDGIVRGFGFERADLQLGRGSNPGVIRAEDQPRGEDDALRGFFDATRLGAVETLEYQARARRDDLLWNPLGVAREVQRVVDRVRPDDVVVDHLAFSARLGLTAAGVRHADVVLGHPSALTVGDEVYGCPRPSRAGCSRTPTGSPSCARLCEEVRDEFTEQWNAALGSLDPGAAPSGTRSPRPARCSCSTTRASCTRRSAPPCCPRTPSSAPRCAANRADAQVDAWLAQSDRPVVYVSLGSFLSVRGDVLAAVAEALRALDVRVALALGSTRREDLGPVPDSWLVREVLPQVTLLGRAAWPCRTAATTASPRRSPQGSPCCSSRCRPTSSPVRPRSRMPGTARRSTRTPWSPARSERPHSACSRCAVTRVPGSTPWRLPREPPRRRARPRRTDAVRLTAPAPGIPPSDRTASLRARRQPAESGALRRLRRFSPSQGRTRP